MNGRTKKLASRSFVSVVIAAAASLSGGCVSSARDSYYSSRSDELAGAGSDGKLTEIKNDQEELRRLILVAHRVQLADGEK